MQFHTQLFAGIFLLAALDARILSSAELQKDETTEEQIRAELSELGSQYEVLADVQRRFTPADGAKESDGNLTDEEWIAQGRARESRAPDPDLLLLPRIIATAKKHPESPYALDALTFVIRRGGPQTGNVRGIPWKLKEQAIELLQDQHMDDPRIVHVFDLLSGALPSTKTESFLRRAFENSPERTTRAAAGLSLARHLDHIGFVHRRSRQLKKKDPLLNYERFWRIVITPYLEKEFPYDRDKTTAEVERLLVHLIDEYSDVSAVDTKRSGPGNVFMELEDDSSPKSYGHLAKSMLFELNNIIPGRQAPDIEGTDAAGNRFRLSDYRGKVVLLTFSADWCGGCVALYPLQRKLVEKFRDQPFVLLSVSQDESIDTLQASLKSGEITWRCWWDGLDGPIRDAWNCRGVPAIILLDRQHIIQDVLLNRFSSQAEFEEAIMKLWRS